MIYWGSEKKTPETGAVTRWKALEGSVAWRPLSLQRRGPAWPQLKGKWDKFRKKDGTIRQKRYNQSWEERKDTTSLQVRTQKRYRKYKQILSLYCENFSGKFLVKDNFSKQNQLFIGPIISKNTHTLPNKGKHRKHQGFRLFQGQILQIIQNQK